MADEKTDFIGTLLDLTYINCP